MGNITIIAKNICENASGSIRNDASQIINQSGRKIIQNSNTGINYLNHQDRQPPTDIRITKVEGPFDASDNLVDKIELGKSYTFKATPTRKPTITEIPLLKWAIKLDDSKKEIIAGVASFNKLENKKIIIALKINHDFEKARIYAFYQKPDDIVSTDLNLQQIEIILVAGTEQHSQTYGNKLMFPAQAVREIRQNYAHYKHATIIVFKDGFTEMELSIIKRDARNWNKTLYFKKINSIKELLDYINKGDATVKRSDVKIGVMKIFSHGLPSILDFGLDGKNSSTQQFGIDNVTSLVKDSFTLNPIIYSYACRTGNSDNRIVTLNPSYKYDAEEIKLVKPKESLAQKLSDHLDASVYAYLRRSNYNPTWLDGGDLEYKKKYITIEDEEVSNPLNPKDWFRKGWDEALWNSNGAFTLPRSGDSPGGLLQSGIFLFEKDKEPSKQ
ncbi:hypothetical protein [Flavobacterium sp. LC2016-01]|uniref:hypothetical protein n=1 Tax=Flavobacterium sp. LC2016-01 TaxID=2675876 RepID=UPI0012BA834C|nr:hypothetical protein [Flavobacterium sp. LC2016-01]MTH16639.1 hypothetical protein [Flavobacterium sp. LC2016-01]